MCTLVYQQHLPSCCWTDSRPGIVPVTCAGCQKRRDSHSIIRCALQGSRHANLERQARGAGLLQQHAMVAARCNSSQQQQLMSRQQRQVFQRWCPPTCELARDCCSSMRWLLKPPLYMPQICCTNFCSPAAMRRESGPPSPAPAAPTACSADAWLPGRPDISVSKRDALLPSKLKNSPGSSARFSCAPGHVGILPSVPLAAE